MTPHLFQVSSFAPSSNLPSFFFTCLRNTSTVLDFEVQGLDVAHPQLGEAHIRIRMPRPHLRRSQAVVGDGVESPMESDGVRWFLGRTFGV